MITFAVVGAGDRGNTYARWIAEHPDLARVVAVAEPREHQRTALARRHDIAPGNVFDSSHFTPENRPAGAADRCLDCAVESNCAYSSTRLYVGMVRTGWPVSVLVDEVTEESVLAALRDGSYGRCVYSGDNDVVDHQVVSMEFAGGTTTTFQMIGFTAHLDRRTQIFGTRGTIDGDGERLSIYDFTTGQTEELTAESLGMDAGTGHGGGDAGLVKAFTTAVATGDPSSILSGPRESLETHLAVFAAERARHRGTVEEIR